MKKEELLSQIENRNCYAFAINYRDYFFIEKSNAALLKLFNDITKNKNNLYCAYPIRNKPVNLKIDIDTFDDLDEITDKILSDVEVGLNNLGFTFNYDTDFFVCESPDKFEQKENKLKYNIKDIL